MDFFGIGFGEIVLILILALILFGPGKLPEAARTLGRYARALKKMSSEFTDAVTKEMDLDEDVKKIKSDLKAVVPGAQVSISQNGDKAGPASVNTGETGKDLPLATSAETGAGEPPAPAASEPKA